MTVHHILGIADVCLRTFFVPMQHIPLHMPDLVSIEVVGKVQAGSRIKKYHLLENSSSKYSFQKQVGWPMFPYPSRETGDFSYQCA